MMAAIQVCLGPKLRLSQWGVSADGNAAVAEGVAWLNGRLDIPHKGGPEPDKRMHDTAWYNGTSYNVFPPLMGFLTALLAPLHRWLGLPEGMWSPTVYLGLVFCPLPVVGFVVFRRQVGDSAWAAVLTLAWMGGTAVLPNLHEAQHGWLGQINHVVSQVGLLILAADCLGRQRIWPGLIGLAISTYTRQLTFLYGLPLLWIAWRKGWLAGAHRTPTAATGGSAGVGKSAATVVPPSGRDLAIAPVRTGELWSGAAADVSGRPRTGGPAETAGARRKSRWGPVVGCLAGLAIIAAPLLVLNQLKFGHSLDFGYRYIYVGLEQDYPGQRCIEHGMFSVHFLRENAYYMHAAPPLIDSGDFPFVGIKDSNPHGTSMWLTTPLLAWALLSIGQWWRDGRRRVLMLGTLPVMFGLLCYHCPGFLEPGYNRFALDFLPIWLVVAAPWTRDGWRTWFTLVCVAWGLLYFQAIVPDVSVRVASHGPI